MIFQIKSGDESFLIASEFNKSDESIVVYRENVKCKVLVKQMTKCLIHIFLRNMKVGKFSDKLEMNCIQYWENQNIESTEYFTDLKS